METYIFSGRVLPERAMVSLAPIKVQAEAGEANFTAEVEIALSVVTVRLTSDAFDSDMNTLKNHVQHIVGSLLDTFGFAAGYGYDVEITAEVAHSPATIFGIGIPEIGASSPAELNRLFEEVFKAAMSPTPSAHLFQLALRDYKDAIRTPDATLFFCYRALETLLPTFKNKSWPSMHEALNSSRTFVEWLREPAQLRRHGHSSFVTGEQRVAALRTAQIFLQRFAAYVASEEPLDQVIFPALTTPLWTPD